MPSYDIGRDIGDLKARVVALETWRDQLDKRPCKRKLTPEQVARVIFTCAILIAALARKISIQEALGLMK